MTFAFVFPGQGSQSLGMMADLAKQFPIVQKRFDAASEVLGFDLWALTQTGPEAQLNATENTQPALLAASVACHDIWVAESDLRPSHLAGHSLGEYSALVCAGAIDFADAIDLVAKRGQYMQDAVPAGTGAMAAIIGLADDAVADICAQCAEGDVLSPANYNSPGQVVIAGSEKAVERAIEKAKADGAKMAKRIPVSVPSHCALMKPAAEKLEIALSHIQIHKPTLDVIHNVDVQSHDDADSIKQCLVSQLYSPVRWVETIASMQANGMTHFIECGPGKVLAGLNKRICRELTSFSIEDPEQLQKAKEGLAQ